jgi:DNA polymerase I-like protein with 3'-5' exonuclease and polymerase domains
MDDTSWTYQLFETAYRRIMDEDASGTLERIYWNIDMPVSKIVEEMESAGVLIDWRWLRKVTAKLEEEKDVILTRIEARLGYQINPKSVPQVSNVLFGPKEQGFLGLSTKYVPFKEKGGNFATGSKEIGHLKRADPLVGDILEWRSKDMLQGSFSEKIADIVIGDPEGRLHAKFNQSGTKIFRFSCVSYDTPVESLRDVSRYPQGVPIQDVKVGDWVYSYDDDLKLTLRKVKNVWKTGTREVVRVHWMKQGHGRVTHGHLDVTPEHPVRKTDGTYVRADLLQSGDRVLALSRHKAADGYAGIYGTRHGLIPTEHRFVYETLTGRRIPRGSVVHHEDRNKLNNAPENLKLRKVSSHKSEHASEQWDRLSAAEKAENIGRLNESWADPKRKRRHKAQLRRMWKDGKFKKPQGDKHPAYEEITTEWLAEKFAEFGNVTKIRSAYGMNYYRLNEVIERLGFVPGNHTITSVEHTGRVVDVYDLEIEGTHNFIAGEICVHNSSNPVNFQAQPRKKKLIRKSFVGHLPEEIAEIKLITSPEERKRREDMLLMLFGADYSQIELRVAAHLSGDENMIAVYMSPVCVDDAGKPCPAYKVWACDECDKQGRKATKTFTPPDGVETKVCPACGSDAIEHKKQCRHVDIHTRTAEDVGVPRNPLAKNLNFGCLYRIGGERFCQYADLYDANGDPRIEYSREVIRGWFSAYPGIRPFHLLTEESLKKNGWIAYTITGRRHRLKQSAMRNEYEAITQGIQFQVSGTAQDIIKIAMRNIVRERELKIANSRPAERALWKKYRFLIQVHDEVIGEGPYALRFEIKDLIERNMNGAAKLRVPLESTAKFGQTWDDIH